MSEDNTYLSYLPNWKFASFDQSCAESMKKWDAVEVGGKFPIILNWVFGTKIGFHQATEICREIFINGLYEPNEIAFIDRFLKEGMVFLDVGANVGLYTIAAAAKVKSTGMVYSFEPSDREYRSLYFNVELNNFGKNIEISKYAIGKENGAAKLNVMADKWSGLNSLVDGVIINYSRYPSFRIGSKKRNKDHYQYRWPRVSGRDFKITTDDEKFTEIGIMAIHDFQVTLQPIDIHLDIIDFLFFRFQFMRRSRESIPSKIYNLAYSLRQDVDLPLSVSGNIEIERTSTDAVVIRGEAGSTVSTEFRTRFKPPIRAVIKGDAPKADPVDVIDVAVLSIDGRFDKENLSRLDVIKIDVEGAELDVIAGAVLTIRKHNPVIMIEISDEHLRAAGSSSEELVKAILSEGYQLFDISLGVPAPLIHGCDLEGNYIGVPTVRMNEFMECFDTHC